MQVHQNRGKRTREEPGYSSGIMLYRYWVWNRVKSILGKVLRKRKSTTALNELHITFISTLLGKMEEGAVI